jgi:dTDP-4-amino-4,6-dideoxygalactose transaminase
MKYPYSSPNFQFFDLLGALFMSGVRAEEEIKNYFRVITGKKYILITNSCRTALFLSYRSLDFVGDVITTPLTCKVAIDPIVESGNTPVFTDIDQGDLNMKATDVERRITKNTKAIQVIHLGGISCKMDLIMSIASKHNLIVIEDCAQALGAKYNGNYTGSFGDIACFSLIKNAYGIGGGILATNSPQIFNRAGELNNSFEKTPSRLLLWRIVKHLIANYKNTSVGSGLFNKLILLKGKRKSYQSVGNQLYHISPVEAKISARQMRKFGLLHKLRQENGKRYVKCLNERSLILNGHYDTDEASFTKFFIYNPAISSVQLISKLNEAGVEAMHLSESAGSPYQHQFVDKQQALELGLHNYLVVHDSLISLPLCESFKSDEIVDIVNIVATQLKSK